MKVNNNFHLNNPVLRYKLDPGEPGMATPTRASQSIAKVATHEGANIRRFKREAIEKGGIVVYSGIYLNLEFKGSFLAATSGKSKALVIVPDEKKENNNIPINKNIDNSKNNVISEKNEPDINKKEEDEVDKVNSNSSGLNNTDEVEEINDVIEKLENEKQSLEAQVTEDKTINYKINDNEQKNTYKEDRLSEIEKRIQYLEQKKDLVKQKEFFSNIINSKNISLKLVNLVYNNINLNTDGTLVNTVI